MPFGSVEQQQEQTGKHRELTRSRLFRAIETLGKLDFVTVADINREWGHRDAFFQRCTGVEWLTVETKRGGWVLRIDHELRTLCEMKRSRHNLNGQSAHEHIAALLSEIKRRRKENEENRGYKQWKPDNISKIEQAKLLDYIEEALAQILQ